MNKINMYGPTSKHWLMTAHWNVYWPLERLLLTTLNSNHLFHIIPRNGAWTTTLPFSEVFWSLLSKDFFFRSSKIHAQRCIDSFTSTWHLFYCVLLVPEYLVWFVSSYTAQADTADPQHHSCFSIHSTELDWRTVRPIQYLDLSSLNMVCKFSSSVTLTC